MATQLQKFASRFFGSHVRHASFFTVSRTICTSFATIILLGAILLMLPSAHTNGAWGDFLTALFTSTSAVCVTGLTAVDTGTYYTYFGQFIIMLLIQIGGLGYMTLTSFLIVMLFHKFSLKERLALKETLDTPGYSGINNFIVSILVVTALFEVIGVILLFFAFIQRMSWGKALWAATFHSVSAFNNAGFSIFSDNLMSYVSSPLVNFTVTMLIIFGGIGYQVIIEIYLYIKSKLELIVYRPCFTLNFNIVTRTTLFLLFFGTLVIWILERKNTGTMAHLSLGEQWMASWFQAVTARTAGFNTVDNGKLSIASLLATIALMFIGGSPGGTAGGIKTTTAWLLYAATKIALTAKDTVIAFERRIPSGLLIKAIGITVASMLVCLLSTMILVIKEHNQPFINLLFEVVSAFGTVGLSTGVTPILSDTSKLALIATMYIGRVNILLLMSAFIPKPDPSHVRYAEGQLLIG
ncbi:MAG: ATPase [Deltaproteobacteria bacterium]|nr:ATPase [Deltaproteobacteria bacterium]